MAIEKNKKALLEVPVSETVKHVSDKKYKAPKPKRNWMADLYGCPFCGQEMPVLVESIREPMWVPVRNRPGFVHKIYSYIPARRSAKCPCGARRLKKACPSCHGNVWFDRSTKIYKHSKHGYPRCGFVGTKRESA